MRLLLRLGLLGLVALGLAPAHAQLRGHGGPVRALTVSSDGKYAISGSLDSSAVYWSLTRNVAEQVLRFHQGAVNAAAFGPYDRIITGGEDGRIALWAPGGQTPVRVLTGHTKPVVALSVSLDGKYVASASWDRTIRIWPLAGGNPFVFQGHEGDVNGVAFMPDSKTFVSAGYDSTLRIWPLFGGAPAVVKMQTPLNAVAATRDNEIVAAGADGRVYFVSRDGEIVGRIHATDSPIIALALARDDNRFAAAGIRGGITIMERKTKKLTLKLSAAGIPVWAIAFLPDSRTLLSGGIDTIVRRWDTRTGDQIPTTAINDVKEPLAAYRGDHGADVFRANCIACHSLKADDGVRAGPTLAGIFGRKVAELPDYNYTPSLKKLDIVWSPETIARMFEVGPSEFMPGTKMPELKIGEQDRNALVKFLQKAAAP